MQIICRGAESIIYLGEWEGQKVLVKERIKKGYRIEQIDEELRKKRTKKETKLLTEARKCGVPTPKILQAAKDKIIMQYIDGKRVKELLQTADKKTVERVCFEIGRLVGKLHAADIVHGDLTTSNMILQDKIQGKIYFIDFGLGEFSRRIEDKAVDLNLLLEALRSTHFKILKSCWQNIVKGYKQECKDAEQVLKKIEEIKRRARYVER